MRTIMAGLAEFEARPDQGMGWTGRAPAGGG
jgi:hypothetical protein